MADSLHRLVGPIISSCRPVVSPNSAVSRSSQVFLKRILNSMDSILV